MNVPPPPPPPPPSAGKAPVPSTNKALLSSIEKGTKLKKVPESQKNDRSGLANAGASTGGNRRSSSTNNSSNSRDSLPNARSVNGDCKQPAMPKGFSSLQSELASQLSSKSSSASSQLQHHQQQPAGGKRAPTGPSAFSTVSGGATRAAGAAGRGAPPPNQYNAASANKPPPPPPLNKKPTAAAARHSISEAVLPVSVVRNQPERQTSHISQPVNRKAQPPVPRQLSSNLAPTQPKPQVTRVTSTPPPPLPNALRDVPASQKASPPSCMAPPVPQRVVGQPGQQQSGNSPQMTPVRTPSIVSQYNVFDRPPPPPPPSFAASSLASAPPPTGASQNFHRYSAFDRRFNFPDERRFPSLRQGPGVPQSLPGHRSSQYAPVSH